MIDISLVSAVLVTRGDVDMAPIIREIEHAGIEDVVIWDNARRTPNFAVFGRYAGIRHALGEAIYVQDDDAIVPAESIRQLVDSYEPGEVVANMPARFRPHYDEQGHWLVGFGAVFGRNQPNYAWRKYLAANYDIVGTVSGGSLAGRWLARWDPTFARTCDVVFTALTPATATFDLEYAERPFATGDDRMYRQPEHVRERMETLERALAARNAA